MMLVRQTSPSGGGLCSKEALMILDIRGPGPQHYQLSEDDHEDETIKMGDISVMSFQL